MTTKGDDMSDHDLELNVTDELAWDPKVDAAEIAVSADEGKITLRGTVGSFRQKREAQHAAERVYGVTKVDNDLEVRLLNGGRRETAEVRGDVLRALELDSLVPETIDADVDQDGFVTLTGTADWQYQRDEAELIAGNVFGVAGVIDDVRLVGPYPDAGDVKHAIKDAFKRNARLDADDLSVSTFDGTVTLEGTVGSWAEHDEAVDAAWAAPGVTSVEDRISVAY
jgi:osmotically-inducible protein OsmY